ncbi:MAG: AraC family transcriptional regulator [Anaerocolumna sp.]|nr:AraC family transcriptional regulator [Anaerocolumna sp.]
MNDQKIDLIVLYKEFFTFVEENIDDFNKINQLIRLIPYSQSAYQYNFKRDFDCTIFEYYSRRRLSRICEELKRTDKTILEIAIEYGYSSQSALNVAFKKYYNITPFDYRKSNYVIPPFFIDINDHNIKNKILGLPYENAITQWVSRLFDADQVKTQDVKVRTYDFDINKENPDLFDKLIIEIVSDLKKEMNNTNNEIRIKTTRLNNFEKKIFVKYIYNNPEIFMTIKNGHYLSPKVTFNCFTEMFPENEPTTLLEAG